MKKTLLTLALAIVGFAVNSQVVFKVNSPASIASGYSLTFAPFGTAGAVGQPWGVPDLEVSANSVTADIKLVAAPDSLACTPQPAGSLTGKIAMLYRGTCNFGSKALAAQTAGAVAVIIVNDIPGEPLGMAGGVDGPSVTIPVIMVSQATGALIKEQLVANEIVNAFIGNKLGQSADDLGMSEADILISKAQSYPLALAANGTEFSVKIGAQVRNYGTVNQTNFNVNAKVEFGGTELYNEDMIVTAVLATGDSVMVNFPDFTETSYSLGQYTITYTVTGTNADQFTDDNTRVSSFRFTNDVVSLGRTDANGVPTSTGGSKPNPSTGDFKSCLFFQDAHASRLGAQGIYFRASKNASGDMNGEEISIQAIEWNDLITNVEDAAFDEGLFGEPAFSSYQYNGNYGDSTIYQAFNSSFALIDNQKYLFCITTTNADIFLGYDSGINYELNQNELKDIHSPIKNGADWRIGFVGNPVSSIALKTFPIAELGVLETTTVQASVYPNPANDVVNIAIAGFVGDANLTVTDITGKIVMTEVISTNAAGKASVNTSSLKTGLYIFNLQMADGTVSNINVAIN